MSLVSARRKDLVVLQPLRGRPLCISCRLSRVILAALGVTPIEELLAYLVAPLDVPVFEAFPEIPGVIARLRVAGIKLAVVTNNWGTTESYFRLTNQIGLGQFDACVVSAEFGCGKPDPRIYRRASDLLGLRPEQCMFVDDVPAHDSAAIGLGYRGVAICRTALDEDPGVPCVRSTRSSRSFSPPTEAPVVPETRAAGRRTVREARVPRGSVSKYRGGRTGPVLPTLTKRRTAGRA